MMTRTLCLSAALLCGCPSQSLDQDCTAPLDSFCAGPCPTLEEVEQDCTPLSDLDASAPSCALQSRLCRSEGGFTPTLWLFDGTALVAVAEQPCFGSDGLLVCDDPPGWTIHGEATEDVLDCIAGAYTGQECIE